MEELDYNKIDSQFKEFDETIEITKENIKTAKQKLENFQFKKITTLLRCLREAPRDNVLLETTYNYKE